jgi:16S rRNA (cytosine1402-N4)-methyltransferase
MSEIHIPVLLTEVIKSFSSFSNEKDLIYFDGTFGRGGHAKALSESYNIREIYATDQDETAIAFAQAHFPQVKLQHSNFYDFALKNKKSDQNPNAICFNMILLDLGVSSPQLDNSERGFSFNKLGPLDMRMNNKSEFSAEHIINHFSEEELLDLFKEYGEIQKPQRVVKAIVKDRVDQRFTTTLQLSGLIERVDGWQKKGFHPATQYFMALRLVVNRELEVVEKAIPLLIDQLKDQGRISIITFHSLEDRIVKNLFKANESGFVVNKKVIVPSEEECKINPRARSAKLRIFQKGSAPVKPDKFAARRALRDDSEESKSSEEEEA